MPLSDIFQVNVKATSPGLTSPGFGKPLILGAYGKTWVERYREYSDIDGVGIDFLVTDPEYLQAARLFQQNPRPPTVAIGRGALPPTQQWAITPTQVNSTVYQVRIGDKTASYTSDSSAIVAEITAGLASAVNALMPAWVHNHAYAVGDRCVSGGLLYQCITAGTSDNTSPTPVPPSGTGSNITDGTAHWQYLGAAVTATDQTTYLKIACQNAGAWQALEIFDPNLLSVAQDHVDPGVATDLAAIKLANNTWWELLFPWNSSACVLAAAGWAETNKKFFAPQVQDTGCEMVAASAATDIAKTLQSHGYTWTAPWYHRATDAFLDAGVSGVCLPTDPGTETWKFKRPAGVPVLQFTPTQKANLDAKNCNYFYDAGGVTLTGEGKVSSGEWIDVVRGRDALAAEIQTRVITAMTDAAVTKIPFTDAGIQVIASATKAALKKFENPKGAALLVAGSSNVSPPKAADVSPTDRSTRVLNGITWAAKYQSAIHSGTVNGVVTY
jgi:hypothetical protein